MGKTKLAKVDSLTKKKCLVCDDTAIGFNFNGLSCGSCRLFFYRNSSKLEKLKCPKDENCLIDFVTRKCCQKCRLTKCFSIGMWPKGSKPKHDHLYTKPQTVRNLLREKIHKKLDNFELNQSEQKYLDDIQLAYESVFPNEIQMKIIGECKTAEDAFNFGEVYVRKVVKFCKSIQTFKQLKFDDQLTILKPFCFEILALRIAYYYDVDNEGYRVVVNDQNRESVILVKASLFSNFTNSHLVEQTLKIALSLRREIENDPTIRNLLGIQLLFRPRDGVTCHEILNYQHNIYRNLLRRYLECKYKSVVKAKQKFDTLTNILQDLCNARDNIRQLMLEVGADVLAKSVAEAFSLTN